MRKFSKEDLDKLNKMIREVLDNYYKKHDADNFFRIDQILQVCRKCEFTTEEVPALIEMQNVIVIG